MAERWPPVIALMIVSAMAFVAGSLGLAAMVLSGWSDDRHAAMIAERGYAPHGSTIAAPSRPDVERPDDGGYRRVSPVVTLDSRRRVPCPHCDDTFSVANLDGHLRFTCPVLAAKRAHPSTRTPGA